MNKKSLGFTLIELLVVVAIISLLSSVVLAAVNEARQRAQVASYRSYLKQFMNAIEMYKNDTGSYPPSYISLSDLTNNQLLNYIKYQEPGKMLSAGTPYFIHSSLDWSFSCGSPYVEGVELTEPYLIFFASSNANLDMKRTYDNNGIYVPVGPYPYSYCVSLKNS